MEDYIVGIDIETSNIYAAVGSINKFNQINVLNTSKQECDGLKKGVITDKEKIVFSIRKALKEIFDVSGIKINSAYVNIPINKVKITENKVQIDIPDKYSGITRKDLNHAMKLLKQVDLSHDLQIIDIIPFKFTIDNEKVVQDPIGCITNTLEIEALIVLGDEAYLNDVQACFRKSLISIDGFVPSIIARKNLVLDEEEYNETVLVIDVLDDITEIAVFEKNKLIYIDSLEVGDDTIINDIAIGLDISATEAKKIKKQYGLAMVSYLTNDNEIMLTTCKSQERTKYIKCSNLVEIIEARVEEIFSIIEERLRLNNIKTILNKVVITGNHFTSLKKTDMIAGKILHLPIKIVNPKVMTIVEPKYATVYSFMKYEALKKHTKNIKSNTETIDRKDSIFSFVKSRIQDFFYQ